MLRIALLASLVPAIAFAQPSPPSDPPAPPSEPTVREGLTFEVSAGPGWIRTSPRTAPSYTSGLSLAFNAGAGVWVTPQLVLGGRFVGVSNFEGGERLGAYVLGPSAQFWIDDRLWVGGGAGVGILASSTSDNDVGFGFDFRGGVVFSANDAFVFDLALEISPARFSGGGDAATLTGIAFVIGLQYL